MTVAIRIADEPPDWDVRSALVLSPGHWKMRNGHTAEILRRQDIPYIEGLSKKPGVYSVWHGRCVECQTPMSWTINGCYAAVGKHRNDIVGKL